MLCAGHYLRQTTCNQFELKSLLNQTFARISKKKRKNCPGNLCYIQSMHCTRTPVLDVFSRHCIREGNERKNASNSLLFFTFRANNHAWMMKLIEPIILFCMRELCAVVVCFVEIIIFENKIRKQNPIEFTQIPKVIIIIAASTVCNASIFFNWFYFRNWKNSDAAVYLL